VEENIKPDLPTDSVNPEAAEHSVPLVEDAGEEGGEETAPLSPQEMDQYECRACGYTYEPAKGDDRGNIAAGVPFPELPDKWRCPVCGAPKPQFSNIGPVGSPSGFKENLGYGLGVNTLTPGQKNILIFGALALGFLFFISLYGLR
jgi:rubredoxin